MESDGADKAEIGNERVQGSHWEKMFFPTEIMNPTPEQYDQPLFISNFTLKLLTDSGWYSITAGVQNYDYGLNKEDFFTSLCDSLYPEYCDSSSAGYNVCF